MEPPVALQVRGPEKLAAAAAIRGANLETCQLDTQCAGFSQVARVICPQTCLDLATLGPTMLFTGAMPQQHYTLVFAIAGNKGGTEIAGIETGYNFKRATEHFEGYMDVFAPGGAVDAITASGYTSAALTVPVEVFHSLLARAFPEVPVTILTTGAAMRTGAAERIRLRSLIAAVEAAIRQPGLRPACSLVATSSAICSTASLPPSAADARSAFRHRRGLVWPAVCVSYGKLGITWPRMSLNRSASMSSARQSVSATAEWKTSFKIISVLARSLIYGATGCKSRAALCSMRLTRLGW